MQLQQGGVSDCIIVQLLVVISSQALIQSSPARLIFISPASVSCFDHSSDKTAENCRVQQTCHTVNTNFCTSFIFTLPHFFSPCGNKLHLLWLQNHRSKMFRVTFIIHRYLLKLPQHLLVYQWFQLHLFPNVLPTIIQLIQGVHIKILFNLTRTKKINK